MNIKNRVISTPPCLSPQNFQKHVNSSINSNESVVRCAIGKDNTEITCVEDNLVDIFNFEKRKNEYHDNFNVVLTIPTGVGVNQGGHAGDATPVAKIISEIADYVFTHPNVVNASDINEIPDNAFYVEGSALSRFLMGTVALLPRRSNKILYLVGPHDDKTYIDSAVNSINASRTTFGLNCDDIIQLKDLKVSTKFNRSGRVSGDIENLEEVKYILNDKKDQYDAFAITSIVHMDDEILNNYYHHTDNNTNIVNPIGGPEAVLTHWMSLFTDKPAAHAPMMESKEMENMDFGVSDPRIASEMISISFMQSVFKGLQRSPKIAPVGTKSSFSVSDIDALVIPFGCLGMPIMAALHQNIPVIFVNDEISTETCKDFIKNLPWQKDQFIEVNSYREAVGALSAIKSGMTQESTYRPISKLNIGP